MNKNRIYYISITTAVGLLSFAAGFVLCKLSNKKESVNEDPEEVTGNESEKIPEEEIPSENEVVEEAIEAIDYDERVKDLEYRNNSGDPDEALDDEEMEELENARINEGVKANAGKIALMEKDDFMNRHEKGFNDVDHDYRDIYYFVDEDYITDEFGGILSPMEKYVGNTLDRFGFKENDEQVVYVENYPMEMDFIVTKISGRSRDEYFDDLDDLDNYN